MPPLFAGRAGVAVVGSGPYASADWPLGKVTLDAETLTVDALLRSYTLRLTDIECIRSRLFTVEVEHHAPDVPALVQLWGFRLFGRLHKAIQQHRLGVKMIG